MELPTVANGDGAGKSEGEAEGREEGGGSLPEREVGRDREPSWGVEFVGELLRAATFEPTPTDSPTPCCDELGTL